MEEKVLKDAVVCFLDNGKEISLARKTKKIGVGRLMGHGGGIDKGETPKSATIRECREEMRGVRIHQRDLMKMAEVYGHHKKRDGTWFVCKVHFYLAKKWKGMIRGTATMVRPRWVEKNKLPFKRMIPTDKDWLPRALKGELLVVHTYLGPFQRKKLRPTIIKRVNSFKN